MPSSTHHDARVALHGLGPPQHKRRGQRHPPCALPLKDNTPRFSKNRRSPKADMTGFGRLQLPDRQRRDRQKVCSDTDKTTMASMLLGAIGITEAHGRGVAMPFNIDDEAPSSSTRSNGTFSVDETKEDQRSRGQLTMAYDPSKPRGSTKGRALLDKYAVMRPRLKAAFEKSSNEGPVDNLNPFSAVPYFCVAWGQVKTIHETHTKAKGFAAHFCDFRGSFQLNPKTTRNQFRALPFSHWRNINWSAVTLLRFQVPRLVAAALARSP